MNNIFKFSIIIFLVAVCSCGKKKEEVIINKTTIEKTTPVVNESISEERTLEEESEYIEEEVKETIIEESDIEILNYYEEYLNELSHSEKELERLYTRIEPDDYLCDSYPESAGWLFYDVYRTKKSKRIISIEIGGAYCAGDSEYDSRYYFNEEGRVIVSEIGGNGYLPELVRFYDAQLQIEYSPSEEQENEKRIIFKETPSFLELQDFDIKWDSIKRFNKKRLISLDSIVKHDKDSASIKEANRLIESIGQSLVLKIDTTEVFSLRKPKLFVERGYKEHVRLNGMDINLKEAPSFEAKSIAKVSYLDYYFSLEGISDKEDIAPYGNHHWYQIPYFNYEKQQRVTGWVFGAFVAKDIYKNKIGDEVEFVKSEFEEPEFSTTDGKAVLIGNDITLLDRNLNVASRKSGLSGTIVNLKAVSDSLYNQANNFEENCKALWNVKVEGENIKGIVNGRKVFKILEDETNKQFMINGKAVKILRTEFFGLGLMYQGDFMGCPVNQPIVIKDIATEQYNLVDLIKNEYSKEAIRDNLFSFFQLCVNDGAHDEIKQINIDTTSEVKLQIHRGFQEGENDYEVLLSFKNGKYTAKYLNYGEVKY